VSYDSYSFTNYIHSHTSWYIDILKSNSFSSFQFGTHLYPLLYSFILLAIVYHAFVTLFLDYSGSYEERCRKWLPVLIGTIVLIAAFMAAPSGMYSVVARETEEGKKAMR
jgi:hypothetical protein